MTSSNNYAVLLGDLSDFISPGTACVNPVFAAPVNTKPEPGALPTVTIGNDDPSAFQSLVPPPPKKAQISLSDCLACSGCLTSAETVLLQQQSIEKFIQATRSIQLYNSPFKIAVVTISSQSNASLAVRFNQPVKQIHQRVSYLLKSHFGVNYLLNAATLAHDISLLEVATEFVLRYQTKKLPLLTSACPGWVCYAEKSQPLVLPNISTAKSAQQVSGVIVKEIIAKRLNLLPSQVYHVTIMPCPDKKLEAARIDFEHDDATDVDCVLTTSELCDLIQTTLKNEETLDSLMMCANNLDSNPSSGIEPLNELQLTGEEPFSGGSGGYLSFCFRFAALKLFGVQVPPGPLPFRQGRNSDTWTVELQVNGNTVLRFGASYGFRNVQEIVRKMKRSSLALDFVEIMACPSGCANGGGQIPNGNLNLVKNAMDQQVIYRSPEDNPMVRQFYEQFVGNGPFSLQAQRLLHTHYHEVKKLESDEAVMAAGW